MKLLTNSRVKARRLCPRYHHYAYEEGWKSQVQSDSLNFGSGFHVGMEYYWTLRDIPGSLLDDDYENARCQALLEGYRVRWGGNDAVKYSTIAVEMEFNLPLIHPVLGVEHPTWRLAGKIDLLAQRLADGAYVLGEHKTSGEDITPGSVYWRRLDMDTQILLYPHALERLGYPVRSILYDVAAKPRFRPKKGETPNAFQARIMEEIAKAPNEYYARCELVRNQREIDEAIIDAWDWAERMDLEAKDGWRPRNPDACFKYNRPCTYFDVCTGLKTPEEMGMVKGNVNAELSANCQQKGTEAA